MTTPPAKRTKHHHDPRLVHQRLVRQHLVPRLPLRDRGYDAGQVVPVQMGALGEPVAHPGLVVASFVIAHVLRGVTPVVHGVNEMAFD